MIRYYTVQLLGYEVSLGNRMSLVLDKVFTDAQTAMESPELPFFISLHLVIRNE